MNNRRQAFVTEYLKDFDAQAAAVRCGYSPRSAHVTGYRLLNDARIGAELAKAAAKARNGSILTLIEAKEIATRIARGCPSDVLRADGTMDLATVRRLRQEVAEVQIEDTKEGRKYRVKFRDALAALDRLAKFDAWDAAAKIDVTSGGQPLRTEIVLRAETDTDSETGEQP